MAVPVHGLPPVLYEGLEVWVVPPLLKGVRQTVVESCFEDDRDGSLIHLEGIGDIDAARALVGRCLLAREVDLPDDLDLHDAERLIGREVVDIRLGMRGVITEVMRGVANDAWAIDVDGEEVLLPVVDHVVSVVPAEGPIAVHADGFYGVGR